MHEFFVHYNALFQIGRVRIDRSMIGVPSDFRHIGHLGADDLTSSCNVREAYFTCGPILLALGRHDDLSSELERWRRVQHAGSCPRACA